MAMPDKTSIKNFYMEGKWTERMLRTAQVCKALSAEEVDEIIAEKESKKEAKAASTTATTSAEASVAKSSSSKKKSQKRK